MQLNDKDLLKVVGRSFLDSFKGKIWKFFNGTFGTLAALFLLGKNFMGSSVLKSIIIGICVLGSIFVIRFLLFLFSNLSKKYKESIYGEAIILLKNGFSEIHYLAKLPTLTDEEFMVSILCMCNELKKVFEKISKVTCSVSIKVSLTGTVNARESVVNLCRDTVSAKTRDTDAYKKIDHSILGNTAYQIIVNNYKKAKYNDLFYVNDNIDPKNKNYLNTSQDAYLDGIYPYKSELVHLLYPIRIDDKLPSQPLGFVCVDCCEKGKLDNIYNIAILQGVADGIYNVIIKRNNIINQNKDDAQTA